jgi:hypothetical protein
LETPAIGENLRMIVIPGRSKERSDAAQTLESMPLRQGVAAVAEFCTVALHGRGHGMDTRVRPEYDDVTEGFG